MVSTSAHGLDLVVYARCDDEVAMPMSTDDPRVPLLDEALMTLDTYRARSPRTRSATATWRSSDAARIIAALPAVGLVLVTKDALDRAEAVVEAARDYCGVPLDVLGHERLKRALAAHDAKDEPTGGSDR